MFRKDSDGWHVYVWRVAVLYVTMLALTGISIFYSYNTNRQSDQKFCEIVMNVNDAYSQSPEPTTELGAKLRQNYIDLERSLNCERGEHEPR